MTPKELFGVTVRVIGLLMVLSYLGLCLGIFMGIALGGPSNGVVAIIFGLPALLIGHWFLRGAKGLVTYAFSDTSSETLSKEIEKRLRE